MDDKMWQSIRPVVLGLAALAALIALAYGDAAVSAQYVHDDAAAITGNPYVAWPPDLGKIFSGRYFGPAERLGDFPSRPAVTLGFCAEVALGLDSSPARHVVQLLMLLASCGLAWQLVARWLHAAGRPDADRTAWLAAALFAVHPLHVESVMQVAYRPELQALALLLLGTGELLTLRLGGPRPAAIARLWLWTALALLSKESSVAVLALWGLWAIATPHTRKTLLAPVVSLAPLALTWLAWRRWNIGSLLAAQVPQHDNPLAWVPAPTRVLSGLELSARALARLVWPVDLAPDYTFDVFTPTSTLTLLGFGGLAGLLCLALATLWLWRRLSHVPAPAGDDAVVLQLRGEGLLLLPAALLLTWLPVSHLLTPATVQFADRLLTTDTLLVAIGGALVLAQLPRTWTVAASVLLLAAAVLQTRPVAHDWTSNALIFQRGVDLQPRALRMRNNLAHALVARGQPAAALVHAQAALALDPHDPNAWTNGLDGALAIRDCAAAEPFVAAMERSTKKAPSARQAAISWGVQCKKFDRAFAIARQLPDRALTGRVPLDCYVLAVAAASADADSWAKRFVPDPELQPAWVSAAAFAEVQAQRPLAALLRLHKAHRAKPEATMLYQQARQILSTLRNPADRVQALADWPDLLTAPLRL